MSDFHVLVKRGGPSPLQFEQNVKSQNAAHAAASGLSLAGGGFAEVIEVIALRPVPGRPAQTIFLNCSQGVYGFCFASRVAQELAVRR